MRGLKTLVAVSGSVHAGDMDANLTIEREIPGDLTACPDCESSRTLVVRDLDLVAFVCEDCGTCWRIELGYLVRLKGTGFSSPQS